MKKTKDDKNHHTDNRVIQSGKETKRDITISICLK